MLKTAPLVLGYNLKVREMTGLATVAVKPDEAVLADATEVVVQP